MSTEKASANNFLPAQPSKSIIWLVQHLSLVDMVWRNRVHIAEPDLKTIASLPAGNGIVLTPNHADEMDPRVCFEVSRRSKQQFVFMCNREAFSEYRGLAGWGLQRIGAYSVERGGHDSAAKQFSVQVVKESKNALVIFPEGEIFYLNQSVQPFHSGAIAIGMQAIMERRQTEKNWTTYLLPMSIRYKYRGSIRDELEKRIARMEAHLEKHHSGATEQSRLDGIMTDVLTEKERRHHIAPPTEHYGELAGRVEYLRKALLTEVGKKYEGKYKSQAQTIDQAFQLSAIVREQLAKTMDKQHQSEYKEDLSTLKEVEHLVALHPDYVEANPTAERVAERVMKLERELLNIKRPSPLGKRDVFVKIGTPIDLAHHIGDYQSDPHNVRTELSEKLRKEIQSLIDADLEMRDST